MKLQALGGDSGVATRSFLRDRAWRNFAETQQSGHDPMSGPEIKLEEDSAKDGAAEKLRCGTIQKEVN